VERGKRAATGNREKDHQEGKKLVKASASEAGMAKGLPKEGWLAGNGIEKRGNSSKGSKKTGGEVKEKGRRRTVGRENHKKHDAGVKRGNA